MTQKAQGVILIMLTKQDLNEIGNLMENKLKPVRKDISGLKQDVSGLKKDVKKLRSDLNTTINFFDKADQNIKSKLNKTRSEVGLEAIEFAY